MKKNNIKKLVGVLSLSLILAGCGEIISKPSNNNDNLLNNVHHEINNDLSKIFTDYRNGSTSKSDVLDKLLLLLAENKFGKYEDADATFKAMVDQRGKEKLFKEINNGNYTNKFTYKFDEKKFIINQVYSAKNSKIVIDGNSLTLSQLNSLAATEGDDFYYFDGLFLPRVNEKNFFEEEFKLVHIDYYKQYIEDNFRDEIYRELLVEEYIKSEQKTSLSRSYAREVNILAIPESTDYPGAARKLVTTYIDLHIINEAVNGYVDLETVASAWRGNSEDFQGGEVELLTAAGITNQTLQAKVEEDYAKLQVTGADRYTIDKEIKDSFTNSGKQSIANGKLIKDNVVRHTDLVTSEWAIKNGGLSSLPSSIRDRLFNIGVANGVGSVLDDKGDLEKAGLLTEKVDGPKNTFVRNINGRNYLVPKMYEATDKANFLLFEDSTFYIVEIKEAINASKLAEGDAAYIVDETRRNEVIDNITREIAELDTSRTNSIKHYLKDLDIVFHDTGVKEYFVSEFPDFFE